MNEDKIKDDLIERIKSAKCMCVVMVCDDGEKTSIETTRIVGDVTDPLDKIAALNVELRMTKECLRRALA